MIQTRWGIKLVVGVPEAELRENPAGGCIPGMMSRKLGGCVQSFERKFDHGSSRFLG